MTMDERLLKTFFDLVQIDSPSGEESVIREYVLNKLNDFEFNSIVDGAGNIIAKNNLEGTPVLLGAHLDTVEPGRNVKPQIKDGYITSDGTTILGADNKATLAAILYALETTPKEKIRPLELVFTVREETNGGINDLDFSVLKSRGGIIADSVAPIGTIIEKAPFIEDIEIKITGKAVHASIPQEGVNALVVASKAISTYSLGNVNDQTIANIGLISGGSGTNTIPENIYLKGEIRSFSEKDFEITKADIENHFKNIAQKFGAKCDVIHEFYGKGYIHDKNSDTIINILKIYENLNIDVNFINSYGASDANIYVNQGINTINIGDGVENAHTTSEKIAINSLEKLAEFLTSYICDRIEAN